MNEKEKEGRMIIITITFVLVILDKEDKEVITNMRENNDSIIIRWTTSYIFSLLNLRIYKFSEINFFFLINLVRTNN